jgi:Mg-chelatase subunit ChlD
MTPLYDAIGHAVNKLKNKIDGLSGYSVLVTILTDGEENASKEYTHEAVVQLITSMRTKGWVFTYIGANHNVEKTAFNLNINNHLHFHATEEDTQQMFVKNSASRAVYMNKLKSGRKDLDADFFKEEEEK